MELPREEPPLPPCYRCSNREERDNCVLCVVDPKFPEPLAVAVRWHRPDFTCFKEKINGQPSHP